MRGGRFTSHRTLLSQRAARYVIGHQEPCLSNRGIGDGTAD
jgi:hypothetical protein